MQVSVDENKSNNKKNVDKAILYVTGSNFLAGFVLLIVYFNSKNIWLLIASILMILAGIAFTFLAKKFNKKLDEIDRMNK